MTSFAPSGGWERFGRVVSGRKSWLFLLLVLLVFGALSAAAPKSDGGAGPRQLPPDSESARVSAELKTFPGGDKAPLIAVFTRPDGGALSKDDLAKAASARSQMMAKAGIKDDAAAGAPAGAKPGRPGAAGGGPGKGGMPPVLPAKDGKAAIAIVPLDAGQNGSGLKETVFGLRDAARAAAPGLTVQTTGGPAFGADTANAFAGADVRLLLATAAVVALLLLVTYRSPVLWLVPLVVVALADRAAQLFAAVVAKPFGYSLDGSTTGILSVLVFGAGTNYALLLVSRYRQELRRHEDHREALAAAVARTGPAILASNVTVVLALLTLLLALVPSTRALGISSSSGLLLALLFALVALPPALALCGRRLFWPFVPRVGEHADEATSGGWYAVASRVAAHPLRTLAVALPVLAILGCGLLGLRIGLDQTEQFRVQAESVDGYEAVKQHFGPGAATPITVITSTDAVPRVTKALQESSGIESVRPQGEHAGRVALQVTGTAEPSSAEAFHQVKGMRDGIGRMGTNTLVGGADAQALDTRDAQTRDRWVIVPAILLVVLAVLLVLLRALPAALLLIGATTLSAFAAIGAGSWLSVHLFGFPGIDTNVILFAFLFLVALGVDYTIFLVTRAQEERRGHGTRDGVVRAVSLTGGVITSAGVVLAAVFVVLGVLPLITMTQLGIVVGLGILLDTFVVRTIVIPALFSLVGDRVWWPQRVRGVGGCAS